MGLTISRRRAAGAGAGASNLAGAAGRPRRAFRVCSRRIANQLVKGGEPMRGRSIGIILLSIYLILVGLVSLLSLGFAGLHELLGLLAIAAGIALILGK
jgi:hypothetical protein